LPTCSERRRFTSATVAPVFCSSVHEASHASTLLALIIQFDSEVNLVQDFTEDVSWLTAALDTLRAGNSTALYDAVHLAADEKLKAEISRAFQAISQDFRGQYSLAYRSTNQAHDGTYRSIELSCRMPDVRIRARKGY
jgi:Mg-chelatase subunit ChlD